MHITALELAAALGGKLYGDPNAVITKVNTDSRAMEPGALFLPLVGEQFDGHDFIEAALDNGAAGTLTARKLDNYRTGAFYIEVPDTHRALRDFACWYKAKFQIPFIGITGSAGKTTTKEMVAAVLGAKFRVHKTSGSFNNDIGLPLTLLALEEGDEMCVLEMGTNHFGEIAYLGEIARPDAMLMTNIGDAHIEFFGTRENIVQAKSEAFEFMKPDALVILNGDDPLLTGLAETLPFQVKLCGTGENSAYRARDIVPGAAGLHCTIQTPRDEFDATIPAQGNFMVYPVLMAAALGEHFGMTRAEIARGVASFTPAKMRMNLIIRDNVRIYNDAYNANPQSMRAALDVLAGSGCAHKVAVLGDMFELGDQAPALHAQVGEYAAQVGIDTLIAIGPLARHIYDAAREAGLPDCHRFETKEEASPFVGAIINRPPSPDSLQSAAILFKASRGMALETLI